MGIEPHEVLAQPPDDLSSNHPHYLASKQTRFAT